MSNHGDFIGMQATCNGSIGLKTRMPDEDLSEDKEYEMTLSPNPTSDLVKLNLFGISGNSRIVISNVLGVELWSEELVIKQKELVIELPISIFKYGVYFVTITSKGNVITKQLIIKE